MGPRCLHRQRRHRRRDLRIAGDVFTIGKLLPMLIFIAIGLFFLNPHSFALGARQATGAFSQSVLLLLYAFTGFEMATIPAGEVRNPKKNMPQALLIATAVVTVTYILIQVVCIGTLPGLGTSSKPLADAGQRFMGTAGAALISAGAMISIAGNLNVLVLSGSRIPFAFAEREQLPTIFARVHRKFFTPYISIVITAAVMLVLTLKSSFVAALTISAIARLVTYAATCAALPVLRRKHDAPKALFRLPGGSLIAIAALLLSGWLLANRSLREGIQTAIAAVLGMAIYASYQIYRKRVVSS